MRILIIAVSVLVLVATTGTIIVGTNSFEGVVDDKPYETGLAWDREREEKARLGWNVIINSLSFRTGVNGLAINVYDRQGRQLHDAVVNVKVSRPSTTDFDTFYPTAAQPDGSHTALIDLSLHGHWDLTLDVKRGEDRAEFIHSIFAEAR